MTRIMHSNIQGCKEITKSLLKLARETLALLLKAEVLLMHEIL